MEIFLKDSLSNAKKQVIPQHKGEIKLYACGVTVYDECHIGHAMQAIFFDVFRRFLEAVGYKVCYVRNYTDVDDKIIDRAAKMGLEPKVLAEQMIAACQRDMENLGVRSATIEPRVSETIPEIIAMIEALIAKDYAYATLDGDVYYRVRKKTDYGKLSNRKPDELRSGNREIQLGQKQDELDFALWKKDETPTASWPSPWGNGRPGWHIECSAMAKKFLGDSFDIHGGGRDLIFPHHENEIAQSEAANGCTFASTWMHSGLLTIDHQKMSKSLGNFITIRDFLKDWDSEVLRLSYLGNHYSSNIDFNKNVFVQSQKKLLYLYEVLAELNKYEAPSEIKAPDTKLKELKEDFFKSLAEDFNTPKAISFMYLLAKSALVLSASKNKTDKILNDLFFVKESLLSFGEVFGILRKEPAHFIEEMKQRILKDLPVTAQEIENLIGERNKAREQKDWAKSDAIRDQLLQQGISLKDSAEKTTWTIVAF